MGSFEQSFADLDAALIDAVADDASLDVAGDGVTVVALRGLFKAAHSRPDLGGLRTELVDPTFQARTVDLSIAVPGASVLTVNGDAHDVIYNDPDGTGMSTLVLRPQD